jgi:hypothetical protein
MRILTAAVMALALTVPETMAKDKGTQISGGGIVSIIGTSATENSIGHGCVVEGRLLSAAHVGYGINKVRWSDEVGREGVAWVAWSSPDGDLTLLETDTPVGPGYERGPRPTPGQKAQVVHFDVGQPNPFAPRVFSVEILSTAAGHIAYTGGDPYYMSGTSGGCLIVDGKAVGITSFMWSHGDRRGEDGRPRGGMWTAQAVSIYGRWAEPRDGQ